MPSIDWRDLAARAAWTAAEGAIGVLITQAADWKVWWAIPLATGLSAVKTWIVGKVGGTTIGSRARAVR